MGYLVGFQYFSINKNAGKKVVSFRRFLKKTYYETTTNCFAAWPLFVIIRLSGNCEIKVIDGAHKISAKIIFSR